MLNLGQMLYELSSIIYLLSVYENIAYLYIEGWLAIKLQIKSPSYGLSKYRTGYKLL